MSDKECESLHLSIWWLFQNSTHLVVLGQKLMNCEWSLSRISWCKVSLGVVGAYIVCNYGLNCTCGVCNERGEGHLMWNVTCLSCSCQRVVSCVWVKEFDPPTSVGWFSDNLPHLVVLRCEFMGSVWLSSRILWRKTSLNVIGMHIVCLGRLKCAWGG